MFLLVQPIPRGTHVRVCSDLDDLAKQVRTDEAKVCVLTDRSAKALKHMDPERLLSFAGRCKGYSVQQLIARGAKR